MLRAIIPIIIILTIFISARGDQELLFEGMYGLFIEKADKEWTIHWMTGIETKGSLAVVQDGQKIAGFETEASTTHEVSITVPTREFELVFGDEGGPWDTLTVSNPDPKNYTSKIRKVDTVFALGDVHGNFDETVKTLQNAKLIDESLHWTGGGSHLVFVGDVLDRGNDALRLIWLVYELEAEAKEEGGGVHMILGNHEIMVMFGDDRYVSTKEQQIATLYDVHYQKLFDPNSTVIGDWLASKPSVFIIDDILFAHGGVITDYGNFNARILNDSIRRFMREPLFPTLFEKEVDEQRFSKDKWTERKSFFYDPYIPFWFRGYVLSDTLETYLDFIHENFGTKVHVVGHTIVPGISERYNGKLIATNLEVGGSEMLMLIRNRKKYERFVLDANGDITPLSSD